MSLSATAQTAAPAPTSRYADIGELLADTELSLRLELTTRGVPADALDAAWDDLCELAITRYGDAVVVPRADQVLHAWLLHAAANPAYAGLERRAGTRAATRGRSRWSDVRVLTPALVGQIYAAEQVFLRRRLAHYGTPPELLADMLQDVAVAALEHCRGFDGTKSHVLTWLGYVVARSVVADWRRSRGARGAALEVPECVLLRSAGPDGDYTRDGRGAEDTLGCATPASETADAATASRFLTRLRASLSTADQELMDLLGLAVMEPHSAPEKVAIGAQLGRGAAIIHVQLCALRDRARAFATGYFDLAAA